jgi:hypothetical protein
MKLNNAAGWAVGIICFILMGFFVPAATCVDGWKSPSIGRQGACSHHGGVKDYGGVYLLIGGGISAALGFYTSGYLSRYNWAARPILPGALRRLRTGRTPKPAFFGEIVIISNAIKSGSRIEFLYKNPTDTVYTKRTIRPVELVRGISPWEKEDIMR